MSQTFAKLTRRIIPVLFVCHLFAILDRINIGVAQIQMKPHLGLSDLAYSLGARADG
ncbi:hypothetical protein PSAC2689_70348 [Paraburkholderia sacchari]|uniref:hypothetical protein n=1 Tax=Paraburkholderia sacchari TaxID=159450 RepID=UPI0039A59EAB